MLIDAYAKRPERKPPPEYDPPVMLRAWAKLDRVPDSESGCLIAWRRAAYPEPK